MEHNESELRKLSEKEFAWVRNEIVNYMGRHDLSQTSLAKVIGVAQSTLAYFIQGRKPNGYVYFALRFILDGERRNG